MVAEQPSEDTEIDLADLETAQPTEIDNGDGTTSILLEDEVKPSPEGWFTNLAATLPANELDDLAHEYLRLIDEDMEDREERDKQQADGIKKSGIGEPAPGGADFEGASRVTHPVLAEAYIDFASSSIKELFPPNGPVKIKIEGKPNKQKVDKAKRKAAFMNWQLTRQIPSYRPELERLLTQLPVGGSQYMKLYWDEAQKRPDVEFVPVDDMVLPYHAKNFFSLPRKFHRMSLSAFSYERRVDSGNYLDLELAPARDSEFDKSASAKATDKIEGKRNNFSGVSSSDRVIYEGCVYADIGDKEAPEGRQVPYLITIDMDSQKVLSLYRNWNESDDSHAEIEHLVDWTFIPWRGIFGLSLLQCVGGLPDALTGSLRALLDSALINNMPGGIKLKGNPNGSSVSISPTQIAEVDAMGQDDIRKIFMPFPFNAPSPMLFQLLGFLTAAAKEVVGTAEEKIADAGANMPVGTTLALIEQGAKVFSAIHARLHDSQRRCLEILHRINRDHLPDGKVMFGSDPEDYVTREDFEGSMDVRPVSDPNIFSETQRFAQIQFVMQTINQMASSPNPAMAQAVSMIDIHALLSRAFELAKVPDFEEFLPEQPKAEPLNPADENVAMVMGKPVKAYEGQNHEAHIQVLLDFAMNPLFGQSPVIAAKFITPALNHLQDHILVWYQEMMKAAAAQEGGVQVDAVNWNDDAEAAVMQAKATEVVDKAASIAFGKIPPIMQQAMQKLQEMAPKPQVDPMVAVAQQDVANKHQDAQERIKTDAKSKADAAAAKLREAYMDYDVSMKKIVADNRTEIKKAELDSKTELAKTVHADASAMRRELVREANPQANGGMQQNMHPDVNQGDGFRNNKRGRKNEQSGD